MLFSILNKSGNMSKGQSLDLLEFDGKWQVVKDFFQLGAGVFGAADNNQALVAVEGGDNAQVVVGFDYLGQHIYVFRVDCDGNF